MKKVEFKPPSDFQPPEVADPGKDWDMVCSFRTQPDGSICMTKLGDTDMPGYGSKAGKEDDEQRYKPGYEGIAKELSDSLGESGAPAPNSYGG